MRLLALLKRLERVECEDCCPECGEWSRPLIHKQDCELKAAINHFERVAAIPEADRTIEGAPFYDPEFREKVTEQIRPLFSMAEIEAMRQKRWRTD